jgi:tRNA(Ile)-lysidine synthase
MPNDGDPIQPAILAELFRRCGLMPSMRCALAVSGGSDSTALMVLYADWLRRQGGDVALHMVLTVDHGLRPESAAEARIVAAQAESLGFPHATLVWEGPKPQTGIQAAARQARYRLMGNSMRASGITLLLTGHTQDDRAETLLMRLARGSGLDGLAGMAPRLHFNDLGLGDPGLEQQEIARPLLDVPRTRLRATLQARGIAWIDDPSNQSPEFERPRLRAARAHLDDLGLTNSVLALSATRLLRARQALDRVVGEFCSPDAGVVLADPCGYITIDRARLQAGGEEITLRVLGRAIAAAGGSGEQVSLAKLESIVASLFGAAPGTARWTLARAMITASEQTITIEREPGREPLPRLELSPGTRACWDGRFSVSIGAGVGTGTIGVRPLGEDAARELYQQGAVTTRIPARAAGMVPSFWQGSRLLAVPTLEFWSDPNCRDALEARFVWKEAVNRLSP